MQKSLTTPRVANPGAIYICTIIFILPRCETEIFPQGRLENCLRAAKRDVRRKCSTASCCSYTSIDRCVHPGARATCVYVNVCVHAGREQIAVRVLLRRIVSRHTPGRRMAFACTCLTKRIWLDHLASPSQLCLSLRRLRHPLVLLAHQPS